MRRDTTYRNYLLDLLSEEESVLLEKRYFSDDQSFQELLEAEDDLIDSYVRGELAVEDRSAFEKRVAGLPRLRGRVDAARGIDVLKSTPRILARHQVLRGGHPQYLAAAAALLFMLAGVMAGVAWWRQRVLLEGMIQRQSRLEQELRLAREELDRDRATMQALTTSNATKIPGDSPTPESTVVVRTAAAVFTLTALTRGSGTNDFVRRSIDERIILRVPIDDRASQAYAVSIEKVSGIPVWRSSNVPVALDNPRQLQIELGAGALKPGDYMLTVTKRKPASDVLQEYAFRIRE